MADLGFRTHSLLLHDDDELEVKAIIAKLTGERLLTYVDLDRDQDDRVDTLSDMRTQKGMPSSYEVGLLIKNDATPSGIKKSLDAAWTSFTEAKFEEQLFRDRIKTAKNSELYDLYTQVIKAKIRVAAWSRIAYYYYHKAVSNKAEAGNDEPTNTDKATGTGQRLFAGVGARSSVEQPGNG